MKTIFVLCLLFLAAGAMNCRPGTFIDGNDCTPCPRGTYQQRRNSSGCRKCPAGTSSIEFSASIIDCTPCDEGTFARRKGSPRCRSCPINTYSFVQGSTACKKCPAGFFSRAGRRECDICPPGFFLSTRNDCTPCPVGFTSAKRNSKSCEPCQKGFFKDINDSQCKKCNPGSFSNFEGAKECSLCPRSSYQNLKGSTTCVSCPPLSRARRGAGLCTPTCSNSNPACRRCPAGEGVQNGSCERCPEGTFSDAVSSTPCQACPGDLVPNSDSTACVCPPGALNNESDGCKLCPDGAFSDDGTECKCRNGKQLENLLFRVDQCLCPPGTKGQGDQCVACTERELTIDRKTCRVCRPLYGKDSDTGLCEICPDGSENLEYIFGGCQACPEGTVHNFLTCTCRPGSAKIFADGPCRPCPAGSRGDSVFERCFKCDGRTSFQDSPGQTDCKTCPPGQISNQRNTACRPE